MPMQDFDDVRLALEVREDRHVSAPVAAKVYLADRPVDLDIDEPRRAPANLTFGRLNLAAGKTLNFCVNACQRCIVVNRLCVLIGHGISSLFPLRCCIGRRPSATCPREGDGLPRLTEWGTQTRSKRKI